MSKNQSTSVRIAEFLTWGGIATAVVLTIAWAVAGGEAYGYAAVVAGFIAFNANKFPEGQNRHQERKSQQDALLAMTESEETEDD